jgi:hypothetical protein
VAYSLIPWGPHSLLPRGPDRHTGGLQYEPGPCPCPCPGPGPGPAEGEGGPQSKEKSVCMRDTTTDPPMCPPFVPPFRLTLRPCPCPGPGPGPGPAEGERGSSPKEKSVRTRHTTTRHGPRPPLRPPLGPLLLSPAASDLPSKTTEESIMTGGERGGGGSL